MALLDDKKRARIFYRFLSKIYDKINPVFWNQKMRDRAIEIADIKSDDRVIDVGCGTGFATIGIKQITENVIGIDQSHHQLEKARKKEELSETTLFLGDAEILPFKDNSFDVVWSSGAIEYWPDPVKTLKELRRVTAPGGKILVVGPKKPENRILSFMAERIMLFYTEEEANDFFNEAGWTNIEHTVMGTDYLKEDALITSAVKPS